MSRPRALMLVLAASWTILPVACGGDKASASCTLYDGDGVTVAWCHEITEPTSEQRQEESSTCAAAANRTVYRDGPCARANLLGGCRLIVGTTVETTWYYGNGSLTVDDIREVCAATGSDVEFVPA